MRLRATAVGGIAHRAMMAGFVLDRLSAPAAAAYSTRRLRLGYAAAALRVRRSSDNAEADIAFTPAGDLDLDALTLHCQAPRRPLDAVAGAAAAYGLRRLRTAYAGPAIRVRRSSDNVEANIGFTGVGDLDTTALLAFIGANSGFVTTWYDQSGNGRNATQATAENQPRIVNAGVIHTAGERPIIVFDGVNDGLVASSWGVFAQPFTRSMVIRTPATIIANSQISNGAIGVPNTAEFYPSSTTVSLFAGSISSPQPVTASERVIFTALYNGASSLLVKNGSTGVFTNAGAQGYDGIRLAGFTGLGSFSATEFQEYVLFQSALSDANRLLLERSQAAYYGITHASPVSGFVTTWYDQSVNARNATQATAARQPRIVNAGVVDTYAGSARPCLRATANGQALNMQGVLGQSLTIGTGSQVWAETGTRDYSTPSYFEAVGGALAWHGALASSASAFDVGFSNARFVNGTHFSNGTPFTFAAPGSVGDKPTSCRIIILNPTLPNSGTPLSASIMNDSRAGIESRWVDAMWEFVLFSTVLSAADRQTLERNQGAAFGIAVA